MLDLYTDRNRLPSVSYHDGDIASLDQVRSILQTVKPPVVIHTASPTMASGADNPAIFEKVNVDGTRNLFECAAKIGVKAFVYTSSASVVHDNVGDLVDADESLPVLRRPV